LVAAAICCWLVDFEGLVIRLNIRGIEHRISHDDVFVEVGAGEVWNDLVNFCVDRNYAGMENLSLIPARLVHRPYKTLALTVWS
jgi:UDP-N-acetylmuramate dehydrogenase